MNNYEYIIAGLPFLGKDGQQHPDTESILEDIRAQLSRKDNDTLDFLLKGYDPEALGKDFYLKAAAAANRFVREYFALDLGVRNAKVEYLNRSLGRPEGTDTVLLTEDGENPEFEAKAEVDAILEGNDILARERALDDFYWKAVDGITEMDVFDLDLILAFVVKLKLVDRWLRLDEAAGRELFRKLVSEIKENYKI
ncbi:MAG: DUF2764 family protein [Bacteroidales bacterium]|nr:DUF2764 family protein [Bacteroidales bacterium]